MNESRLLLETPHGRVLWLDLPDKVEDLPASWWDELHPAERAHANGLGARRVPTWIGGRRVLRAALDAAGLRVDGPILSNDLGAPDLPPQIRASISHKRSCAVALIDRRGAEDGVHVGVDLEELIERRGEIAPQVLTAEELESFGSDWRLVLTAFSAKEAIYKALNPWVRRWVGFKEAVIRFPDGEPDRLQAELRLKPQDEAEGPFSVELLRFRLRDDLIMTTARIGPRQP